MPTIPTKVALVGNPNAGKSSLFNLLTGLHQKVGNYPGVTVDIKSGIFQNSNGEELLLIDLPGTYSLHPNTQDEYLLTKILCNPKDEFFPDHILYVADSTQLDKQLLLLTQILDLGIPTSLILTMKDIRTKDSTEINIDKINKLLEIPTLETDLKNENNKKEIVDFVLKIEDYQKTSKTFFNIPSDLNNILEIIQSKYSLTSKYQAYLSLNHFEQLDNITDKNFLKNLFYL